MFARTIHIPTPEVPMTRTTLSLLLAAGTLLAPAAPSMAQVQARPGITLDGAQLVLAAAQAEARRQNCAGVIAVVDEGGNLVALTRLDGTFPAGAMVSIGKARTAALFRKPTAFFEEVIRNGRTAMTALDDFTPLQGGVPILVDGQVVGAVGVSGASSAMVDEVIASVAATAASKAATALAPLDKSEAVR
jgi:glc operon protein GlcG